MASRRSYFHAKNQSSASPMSAPALTFSTKRKRPSSSSPEIPGSEVNSPEICHKNQGSSMRVASPELASQDRTQRPRNSSVELNETTSSAKLANIPYDESDCETDSEIDVALNNYRQLQAREAADAKNFDKAEKHLDILMSSKNLTAEERSHAQLSMAVVKCKLGCRDEAVEMLKAGGFDKVDNGNVILLIAETLYESKEYADCLSILADIAFPNKDDENVNIHHNVGDLLLLRSRVLVALEMYEQAQRSCKKAMKVFKERNNSNEKLRQAMALMAEIMEACGHLDAEGYRAMAKDLIEDTVASDVSDKFDSTQILMDALASLSQSGDGAHDSSQMSTLTTAETETMLAKFGLSINAEGSIVGKDEDILSLVLLIMKSRDMKQLAAFAKFWPLETPLPGPEANNLIHYAAEYGNWPAITHLITLGANLHATDKDGLTPLHYSSQVGAEVVTLILLKYDATPDLACSQGRTPLHMAIQNFCPNTAALLLLYGANPNSADNNGLTPLHIAAQSCEDASILLLLQNGADIDKKDQKGYTALHHVALLNGIGVQKKWEFIRFLMDAGADVTLEDNSGNTAEALAKGKKLKKLLAGEKQ